MSNCDIKILNTSDNYVSINDTTGSESVNISVLGTEIANFKDNVVEINDDLKVTGDYYIDNVKALDTQGTSTTICVGPTGTISTNSGNSVVIGEQACESGKAYSDVWIGYQAGKNTSHNNGNIGIGANVGTSLSNNSYGDILIGTAGGIGTGTSQDNIFMGRWTGSYSAGSQGAVHIGYQACRKPSSHSVYIGTSCGGNTAGTKQYNIAVGAYALYSHSTTSYNTAFGYKAGYTTSTGSYNTYVGTNAGYSLTTESYSTFIGNEAGYNATSANSVFIGNKAGYNETDDNMLHIANTDSTSLIEGHFVEEWVKVTGSIETTDKFICNDVEGYTGDLNDSTSTKIADVVGGIITAVYNQ